MFFEADSLAVSRANHTERLQLHRWHTMTHPPSLQMALSSSGNSVFSSLCLILIVTITINFQYMTLEALHSPLSWWMEEDSASSTYRTALPMRTTERSNRRGKHPWLDEQNSTLSGSVVESPAVEHTAQRKPQIAWLMSYPNSVSQERIPHIMQLIPTVSCFLCCRELRILT